MSNIDKSAFQAIDQYALGTPNSAAKSIDSLAAYLIQPAKNDTERARAIYRWITQNISYDFSAYLSKNYGSTKTADVLTSRSSICEGYSGLFHALAESAGLEVITISGWAKGYSYNAGDPITGPTNHAWNAVKISGGWYLIDSTWGAGAIVQQRFVREFDEAYFLTPPEQFIYNHLPEDSKWQLLSTPLSKTDFSALPYVHSKFFSYGLELGNNTQSVINAKGSLSMTFPVPRDTYLMARLSQGNVELAETFTSTRRSGNQYQINATFPNPGTYILSLFARKNSEFGMYDGVLEYKVHVDSTLTPAPTPIPIPTPTLTPETQSPSISLFPSLAVRNQVVIIRGTNWVPFEMVTITIVGATVHTVTAVCDRNGSFVVSFVVPASFVANSDNPVTAADNLGNTSNTVILKLPASHT